MAAVFLSANTGLFVPNIFSISGSSNTVTRESLLSSKLFDQMYKTPGYLQGNKYAYGPAGFVKDHIQAMQPDWVTKIISDLLQAEADGNAPNWDMVTNPTFEDKVGAGRHALADMLIITKTSKHMDAFLRSRRFGSVQYCSSRILTR